MEFLKYISNFDDKIENLDYNELVNNLDLLEKVNSKINNILVTTRMKKIMLDFGERETDIYIVSFPRSGTTLMQMILYQLTTDGGMDFGHIYDVSPWCRFSAYYKRDMPSVGERRIIKSHDEYNMLENVKHGKFIFLIRDCLDTIVSIHQQTKDYIDPQVDFNDLTNRNMKKWFKYNTEWINNKNDLKILFVNYEDLIKSKEETILKISAFLDIKIDDNIMDRTLQSTSFDFMKQHETKFGEQPEQGKIYNNFIRNGRVGDGKFKFTEDQLKEYIELSKEYIFENDYLKRYF